MSDFDTSAQRFTHDVTTHFYSGIGVIFVKTNEPKRMVETVNELAIADNSIAKVWKVAKGWEEIDGNNLDGFGQKVLNEAVDKFLEVKGNWNYAVVQWPHFVLSRTPPLLQMFSDLMHSLESTDKRIILLIPSHADIPEELSQIPVVEFELPTQQEAQTSLQEIIDTVSSDGHELSFTTDEISHICRNSLGLTKYEMMNAFSMVLTGEVNNLDELTASKFAKKVGNIKTDVVNKSNTLEVIKPIPMDEVGGLEVLKNDLKTIATCLSPAAERAGIPKPKGILLVGNPGSGKSLSAQAISGLLGIPLIKFDVSRVFGSLVGSSEKNMKKAIDTIDAIGSAVVMVDEVDKVFSQGGGNDSGTSTRVLGTLLTKMQEGAKNGGTIYWVLTANRVDNLPAELVRKGRIDEIYSVTYPNSTERKAIAEIHLNKYKIKIPKDLDVFVKSTENYVGSEIESAVITSMRESFVNNGNNKVAGVQLLEVIKRTKSIYEAFKDQAQQMSEWAENHCRSASLTDEEINDLQPIATNEPKRRIRKRVLQ